jgi:hypothetical protein
MDQMAESIGDFALYLRSERKAALTIRAPPTIFGAPLVRACAARAVHGIRTECHARRAAVTGSSMLRVDL